MTPTSQAWTHRPELDGLRTFAVYLVLLFHAGVGAFGGGFVGVDLFFVLSGFLVTSILLQELHQTGRLRLGRFYGRRARRLLPAAVVVIVITSAVWLLFASAIRRAPWVGDAQASLLYVANWRFLGQSSDYFAADIDQSPFLHFWSLSIEEQYYFAFPLLLIGLFWLRRHWRHAVPVGLGVLLIASVGAQLYWAGVDANHAYYGTDARLYQLLAGGLAAVAWRPVAGRLRVPGLTATVMLVSLLLVSSSWVDVGPSARGLLVTPIAVLLILAVMTRSDRPMTWLLNRPTMTYLGRISYGTYLWHWPVILILLEVLDASPWVVAGLSAAVATGLAALSFEVLEQPIRRMPRLSPYGFRVLVGGVSISALVAFIAVPAILDSSVKPVVTAGAPSSAVAGDRDVPTDVDWASFKTDMPFRMHCKNADDTSCVLHDDGEDLHVAVVGDSYVRELAPLMTDLAEDHDFKLSVSYLPGCPWQVGVVSTMLSKDRQEQCGHMRSTFFDSLAADTDVDVVVLSQLSRDSAAWRKSLQTPDGAPVDREMIRSSIEGTVEQLTDRSVPVVLMNSWITPGASETEDPLACLSGARRTSECLVEVPLGQSLSDTVYDYLALTDDDLVSTVDINETMCPQAPVCQPLVGEVPVWVDSDHYSAAGLQAHAAGIWEELKETGEFG